MLLAVEGGGFFSSSASGYSKGLSLLILGRQNEERPMRVSPWNQYHLVEREADPNHQLASKKNRGSNGCSSFICFGHSSAELDGQSPPNLGPNHQSETILSSSASSGDKFATNGAIDEKTRTVCLKSSLRKIPTKCSVVAAEGDGGCVSVEKVQCDVSCGAERRKVQWTDSCGMELAEIREFEVSDDGASDEDFESEGDRRCQCVIQ